MNVARTDMQPSKRNALENPGTLDASVDGRTCIISPEALMCLSMANRQQELRPAQRDLFITRS